MEKNKSDKFERKNSGLPFDYIYRKMNYQNLKLLVDISKFKIDNLVLGRGYHGLVRKRIRPASRFKPELVVAVKYLRDGIVKTGKGQKIFCDEVALQCAHAERLT